MFEPPRDAPDVPDFELRDAPADSSYAPSRTASTGVWIVLAVLAVAAGVALYVVFGRRETASAPAVARERIEPQRQAAQPLGGDAAPIDVPPLDQTDPLVRELVRQVSSHPQVAAWLTTDGLIRNFTLVVANITENMTPARHLRTLRPGSTFQVIERGEGLSIDPRSYQRYDALAAAAASIDPAGAARLYATLKPRIEEAYRDLGYREPFDRALERAIVVLLQTPVVNDPVLVRPKGGTGYAFADPALESLTAPQKQLLRTGPRNIRTIQASLHAIALALGIPGDRLPALRP